MAAGRLTAERAAPSPRERVARAISATTLDWGDEDVEVWDTHRHAADAAIAEILDIMTHPSPEMIAAAVRAWATSARPMPAAIAAAAKVALGGDDA